MQTKFTHSELGEILLSQSLRAKRISLSVLSSGVVRLSFPKVVAKSEALKFLELKKQWVEQAKSKVQSRKIIVQMPFSTRSHTLKIVASKTDKFTAKITDSELIFSYPSSLQVRDDRVQDAVKKALIEVYRIEAKELLPRRLAELAREHNFKFSTVSVRNTHTRWGSCSARNSISLSLSLMRLPDYLIDYVLLHELCHTVHKNHGVKFYELLDKVSGGNHKKYNAELKKFTTRW
ncbi:MAG: SprT family zinc-dependent metalloprotease [Rikenellaceae bacterium]